MSSRSRRWLKSLLLLCALAGAGATAGWWWYRTTRPEYRLHRGREAVRQQDWDRASHLADRLEKSGAANQAHLLRGEVLLGLGRPGPALRELNRVRDQGELRVQATALAGRCLLELKRLREAHRAFSFVLDHDPDHADAHRGMAAIAYDLGNLPPALDHLERVAHLDPSDGRPHRLMGLIHTYLGQEAEAEDAYRQALEHDLTDAFRTQVHLELAECLLRRTRYEAALEQLDRRRELPGGEDVAAVAIRAECLWKLNRRRELSALLEDGLARYPRQWQLLLVRGMMHLDAGETAQAIAVLERAVREAPAEYRCGYQLALAYSAAGRTTQAAAQHKQAARLRANLERLSQLSHEAMKKPWDAAVREQLAALCDEMDNQKLAAMWRQAAQACRAEE